MVSGKTGLPPSPETGGLLLFPVGPLTTPAQVTHPLRCTDITPLHHCYEVVRHLTSHPYFRSRGSIPLAAFPLTTTRKRAHDTERELDAVFEHALYAIAILDDESACVDANPRRLPLLERRIPCWSDIPSRNSTRTREQRTPMARLSRTKTLQGSLAARPGERLTGLCASHAGGQLLSRAPRHDSLRHNRTCRSAQLAARTRRTAAATFGQYPIRSSGLLTRAGRKFSLSMARTNASRDGRRPVSSATYSGLAY